MLQYLKLYFDPGMLIFYKSFNFSIKLQKKISIELYPPFVMRSVLGKELRHLCCLFKGRHCDKCDLKYNCPYSYIFETPIPKNTKALPGRNRAPHPIILNTEEKQNQQANRIHMTVTLLGKAIEYLPYVYYSLKKAGEHGLFRQRTKYTIEDITSDGVSLINSDGTIDITQKEKIWEPDNRSGGRKKGPFLININSPFRYKKDGKYCDNPDYRDILTATARKVNLLSAFHGKKEQSENITTQLKKIKTDRDIKSNLYWVDLHRFSARQRKNLKLGGVVGSMEIPGPFTFFERSLLEAAELFNIGKNQSFGLGDVTVREVN